MFLIFGAFVAVLVPKSMAMESASLDKLFCDVLAADIRSHMADRYMRHLSWQGSSKRQRKQLNSRSVAKLEFDFRVTTETYNELLSFPKLIRTYVRGDS